MAFCKEIGILFYVGMICLLTVFAIPFLPNKATSTLNNALTPEQLVKYKAIKKQRGRHAAYGLVLGALVGAIVAYFYRPKRYYERIGLAMIAFVLVLEFVYMLLPKTDYLINSLRSDQLPLWLKSYNTWKRNAYLGFAGSAIAVICFLQMQCNKRL